MARQGPPRSHENGPPARLFSHQTEALCEVELPFFGVLRSLYTGSCIIAPSETAKRLARELRAGRTEHSLWDLGWVCSVLHRRGTVILCKTEGTKPLGLRFSATLTDNGAQRLELATV